MLYYNFDGNKQTTKISLFGFLTLLFKSLSDKDY